MKKNNETSKKESPFFQNLKEVQNLAQALPEWQKHSLGKVVKKEISSSYDFDEDFESEI